MFWHKLIETNTRSTEIKYKGELPPPSAKKEYFPF